MMRWEWVLARGCYDFIEQSGKGPNITKLKWVPFKMRLYIKIDLIKHFLTKNAFSNVPIWNIFEYTQFSGTN